MDPVVLFSGSSSGTLCGTFGIERSKSFNSKGYILDLQGEPYQTRRTKTGTLNVLKIYILTNTEINKCFQDIMMTSNLLSTDNTQ